MVFYQELSTANIVRKREISKFPIPPMLPMMPINICLLVLYQNVVVEISSA